jgi:hypothetical protein
MQRVRQQKSAATLSLSSSINSDASDQRGEDKGITG